MESKYKTNKLTCDELVDLRSKVNSMSDKEIASSMEEDWNRYVGTGISAPDSCYEIIKQATRQIPQQKTNIFKRISQIAAAILIPLLITTSIYLYNETKVADSKIMTISTGVGERANITLPDGTNVVVNTESTLSYTPSSFSKSERLIQFEGEAYFNVKKDPSTPFIIKTTDVKVEVLGTKFNLCARLADTLVELDLEQGSVLFSSLKSREECTVAPNQSVTMNKLTGKITLTSMTDNEIVSPWRRAELNFRNAPLKEVFSIIESTYGVTVTIQGKKKPTEELFTGTIADNNLVEAIEVLERSFHIKAKIVDKTITFTDK